MAKFVAALLLAGLSLTGELRIGFLFSVFFAT
jgi:hypothetical protein